MRLIAVSVGIALVLTTATGIVQAQNRPEFEALLTRALAIDPDARPEWRLQNLIAQRRARWLMARADDLFAN